MEKQTGEPESAMTSAGSGEEDVKPCGEKSAPTFQVMGE
jgi:hypothetical protein